MLRLVVVFALGLVVHGATFNDCCGVSSTQTCQGISGCTWDFARNRCRLPVCEDAFDTAGCSALNATLNNCTFSPPGLKGCRSPGTVPCNFFYSQADCVTPRCNYSSAKSACYASAVGVPCALLYSSDECVTTGLARCEWAMGDFGFSQCNEISVCPGKSTVTTLAFNTTTAATVPPKSVPTTPTTPSTSASTSTTLPSTPSTPPNTATVATTRSNNTEVYNTTCCGVMSVTRCTVRLACVWDAVRNSCRTKGCADIFTSESCKAAPLQEGQLSGCTWDGGKSTCLAPGQPPCTAYFGDACPLDRCNYNASRLSCYDPYDGVPCGQFFAADDCPARRCNWTLGDFGSFQCNEVPYCGPTTTRITTPKPSTTTPTTTTPTTTTPSTTPTTTTPTTTTPTTTTPTTTTSTTTPSTTPMPTGTGVSPFSSCCGIPNADVCAADSTCLWDYVRNVCRPQGCADAPSLGACAGLSADLTCAWNPGLSACRGPSPLTCGNFQKFDCAIPRCAYSTDFALCYDPTLGLPCGLSFSNASCPATRCAWVTSSMGFYQCNEVSRVCYSTTSTTTSPTTPTTTTTTTKQTTPSSTVASTTTITSTVLTSSVLVTTSTTSPTTQLSSTAPRTTPTPDCCINPTVATCNGNSKCRWSYTRNVCRAPECEDATDQSSCTVNPIYVALGCRWNASAFLCKRPGLAPCLTFQGSDACPRDRCQFDAGLVLCYDIGQPVPCGQLFQQNDCPAGRCVWAYNDFGLTQCNEVPANCSGYSPSTPVTIAFSSTAPATTVTANAVVNSSTVTSSALPDTVSTMPPTTSSIAPSSTSPAVSSTLSTVTTAIVSTITTVTVASTPTAPATTVTVNAVVNSTIATSSAVPDTVSTMPSTASLFDSTSSLAPSSTSLAASSTLSTVTTAILSTVTTVTLPTTTMVSTIVTTKPQTCCGIVTPNPCEAFAGCSWDYDRNLCRAVQCEDYFESGPCAAGAAAGRGCTWNPALYQCLPPNRLVCKNAVGAADCLGPLCAYDQIRMLCYNASQGIPCGRFLQSSDCPAGKCAWTACTGPVAQCMEVPLCLAGGLDALAVLCNDPGLVSVSTPAPTAPDSAGTGTGAMVTVTPRKSTPASSASQSVLGSTTAVANYNPCPAGSVDGDLNPNTPCENCPTGTFQPLNGESTCNFVRTCGVGLRQGTAPTTSSDRVCVQCSGGTEYSDVVGALSCKSATVCVAGTQWQQVAATPSANTRCAAVTACAVATQWQAAAATATSNTVCRPVTVCNAAVQWQVTAATATADTVCRDLTVCASGFYQTAAPTRTSDRVCLQGSVCTAGAQFAAAPASGTTDTRCVPLTVCTNTQYRVKAPTATSDRVCVALTTCEPPAVELAPPTATSDRVCFTDTAASRSGALSTGAVVGIIVGGVVGVVLVAIVLLVVVGRRRRSGEAVMAFDSVSAPSASAIPADPHGGAKPQGPRAAFYSSTPTAPAAAGPYTGPSREIQRTTGKQPPMRVEGSTPDVADSAV